MRRAAYYMLNSFNGIFTPRGVRSLYFTVIYWQNIQSGSKMGIEMFNY